MAEQSGRGHHGRVGSYREHAPQTALADQVACMWTRTADESSPRTRVVPDGCIDLIWTNSELTMIGPDTGPRLVPTAADGVVGIRLKPGSTGLLLGDVPASELRDAQIDITALWRRTDADTLADRMAAATTQRAAAQILEQAALDRLPRSERDPGIEAAVAALERPSPPSIRTLADNLGLSERHFRRRFSAAVGYGPKTLEQVLRFRRVLELAPNPGGLADLAAHTGYADQAHLTREVRRLSGLTPRELLNERNARER